MGKCIRQVYKEKICVTFRAGKRGIIESFGCATISPRSQARMNSIFLRNYHADVFFHIRILLEISCSCRVLYKQTIDHKMCHEQDVSDTLTWNLSPMNFFFFSSIQKQFSQRGSRYIRDTGYRIDTEMCDYVSGIEGQSPLDDNRASGSNRHGDFSKSIRVPSRT